MVPFFANTGTQVSIDLEESFRQYRRELGARFSGMSTDPQTIRTGLRGINVDHNKKRSRREVAALRLVHNQSKENFPALRRVQSNPVQCDGAPAVL